MLPSPLSFRCSQGPASGRQRSVAEEQEQVLGLSVSLSRGLLLLDNSPDRSERPRDMEARDVAGQIHAYSSTSRLK